MFSETRNVLIQHVKNNLNIYFFLLLAFIIGVSAGAFTVNGLSAIQRDELKNYFQGFLQLIDNQNVDSGELFKIAVIENTKILVVLWLLGVSIIGIPFIFVVIGIRGFLTGFSSGIIIQVMGLKGILFIFISLLPKEVIIVPCIIGLGVSGINFSLGIIKNRTAKQISRENLKTSFIAYCFTAVFFACFVFVGILVEVYVTPVFIRIIAPIVA